MTFWKRDTGVDREVLALARRSPALKGDKVIAAARDTATDVVVVAAVRELVVLDTDGQELWRRPWLFVDAGSWEDETGSISVMWTDGGRGTQWTVGDAGQAFAEAFRDRVEASRVVDAPVLDDDRTIGRAAIRKDLRTGELVPQLILDRRVRRSDERAHALGEATLRHLREQVGL